MKNIINIKKNLLKIFKMKNLEEVKNILNLYIEYNKVRKIIDID